MATDPTFRSYNTAQAQQYAGARLAYSPVLYEHILTEYGASGGSLGFLLDVGCGPGSATRDLAPMFEHAVGLDPGHEMIKVAREWGGKTKSGEDIRYEVCEAERMTDPSGLPMDGVDLICAATAAHWFDMKSFWSQAACLLRPNGTVALWIKGASYAHPSMPYAAAANAIYETLWRTVESYFQPGNVIAHNLYDKLELPWESDPTQTAFPQDKYRRFDWDRDGVLSDGKDYFGGSQELPFELYENVLETVSAVTRWRKAHPNLVGTERDCVTEHVSQMKEVVGDRPLRGGSATALLMFKRTAS